MMLTYDAVSIHVKSPDGDMTVIFSEENGRPIRVEIFIGKSGHSLRAWAVSFSEIVSLGLQNGVDLDSFCNVLYGQTTDKITLDTSGLNVTSGPEAFALAILKYKKYKMDNPSEIKYDGKVGYFTKRRNLGG